MLTFAASQGHADIASFLLSFGADPNMKTNINFDYEMPLHRACYFNRIEIVKLLIDHNADIEARTRNKVTPL